MDRETEELAEDCSFRIIFVSATWELPQDFLSVLFFCSVVVISTAIIYAERNAERIATNIATHTAMCTAYCNVVL